jgi:hypothetical protein
MEIKSLKQKGEWNVPLIYSIQQKTFHGSRGHCEGREPEPIGKPGKAKKK